MQKLDNNANRKGIGPAYDDNRKKIATGRPKVADLPKKLAAEIKASSRYWLEQEFYQHAVRLHNERTARLPNFAEHVRSFIKASNSASRGVSHTRHEHR